MTKISLGFSLSPHYMAAFWLTGSGKSRKTVNMPAWI